MSSSIWRARIPTGKIASAGWDSQPRDWPGATGWWSGHAVPGDCPSSSPWLAGTPGRWTTSPGFIPRAFASCLKPMVETVTRQVRGVQLFERRMGDGSPTVVLHGGPGAHHDYLLPGFDALATGRT